MTNKNLIERLWAHSQHCAEAYKCEEYLPMAEFWAKYENLSGEAAALIEQQEAVIAALQAERVSLIETKREQLDKMQRRLDLYEAALSFVRRWAIEKEGNGTSAEERLSVIANYPAFAILAAKTHLEDK